MMSDFQTERRTMYCVYGYKIKKLKGQLGWFLQDRSDAAFAPGDLGQSVCIYGYTAFDTLAEAKQGVKAIIREELDELDRNFQEVQKDYIESRAKLFFEMVRIDEITEEFLTPPPCWYPRQDGD